MKYRILILFIIFSISGILYGQSDYDRVLDTLYSGTVELIATDKLEKRYSEYVILDVRSKAEYNTSHLKGAIWVDYDKRSDWNKLKFSKSQKLVVYCTVGYRSEKLGEYLKNRGFQSVENLYGGLIQWVNEGRPVFDLKGNQTEKVHTYNALWGIWLKKGEKVYE